MAAATGATNTGDKITLALIGQKLDALAEANKESHNTIMAQLCDTSLTVKDLQIEQGKHSRDIENIKKDIDDNIKPEIKALRNRDTFWSSLNSLGILIAGYLGLK